MKRALEGSGVELRLVAKKIAELERDGLAAEPQKVAELLSRLVVSNADPAAIASFNEDEFENDASEQQKTDFPSTNTLPAKKERKPDHRQPYFEQVKSLREKGYSFQA